MAGSINSDDLPEEFVGLFERLEAEAEVREFARLWKMFAESDVKTEAKAWALAEFASECGGDFDLIRKRASEIYKSESGFSQFSDFYRSALRNDLSQDEQRSLYMEFYLYQLREPGQWRAIQNHPEEFHDFMRKVPQAFYKGGKFDAKVFFGMIKHFAQKEISAKKESFSELCCVAVQSDLNQDEHQKFEPESSANQFSQHGQGCAIQKHPEKFYDFMSSGERLSFDCRSSCNHVIDNYRSCNHTEKVPLPLKENLGPGLLGRDPRWHAFLFMLNGAVSSSMIYNFKSGSVLPEIMQSIPIGAAGVGSCASLACLCMLYQQWSLPNGFEREVWIQMMESVATVATSSAFIVSMLLLLPNNLSRCIVGGVLCAVVVLIVIFAKCRPKREAETELASYELPTDSASDPLQETATEVASNLLPQDSEIESGDSIV